MDYPYSKAGLASGDVLRCGALAADLLKVSGFQNAFEGSGTRASQRRTAIRRWIRRANHEPEWFNSAMVEQVSRHLQRHMKLIPSVHDTSNGAHDLSTYPTIDLCTGALIVEEQLTQPTPKEKPMTATKEIITITTKTLVNGQDIADFSDAQIFAMIRDQEKLIDQLNEIKNKPKKLVAEVEKRQAGIKALVEYLDSKPD